MPPQARRRLPQAGRRLPRPPNWGLPAAASRLAIAPPPGGLRGHRAARPPAPSRERSPVPQPLRRMSPQRRPCIRASAPQPPAKGRAAPRRNPPRSCRQRRRASERRHAARGAPVRAGQRCLPHVRRASARRAGLVPFLRRRRPHAARRHAQLESARRTAGDPRRTRAGRAGRSPGRARRKLHQLARAARCRPDPSPGRRPVAGRPRDRSLADDATHNDDASDHEPSDDKPRRHDHRPGSGRGRWRWRENSADARLDHPGGEHHRRDSAGSQVAAGRAPHHARKQAFKQRPNATSGPRSRASTGRAEVHDVRDARRAPPGVRRAGDARRAPHTGRATSR